MNVFIMILAFIFMAGYFLMESPSQRVHDDRIESAIRINDIKSTLLCMARAHANAIEIDTKNRATSKEVLEKNPETCVQKYDIKSIKLCANENREISNCTPDRVGKTVGNFIVTTAGMPPEKDTNLLLKTLSQDFYATPNFGMIISGEDGGLSILSGNGYKRAIPASIVKSADFKNGQLVYITQYSALADVSLGDPAMSLAENTICSESEQKVFRFGKWECMAKSSSVLCTGDTIWNSSTETCEIDPSLRPLCAIGQSAVDIDGVWNCIDPSPTRECPDGMTAQIDYINMEWTCVAATNNSTTSKCTGVMIAKGGLLGGTLLRPTSPCGDCEKMIVNEDTCAVACVPDETKISKFACYSNPEGCTGDNRAFYFGFSWDSAYIESAILNLPQLASIPIPLDDAHSINRKFNCMDCTAECGINEELSLPPYIVVCNGCD